MKSLPKARSPTLLRILLHSGFGAKCGAPHFAPLLPNTQARLWGPAVIPSFAKDEAKGTGGPTSERLPTAQSLVIATETGPAPPGKGEPVMAVSAPVLGSIVY